MSAVEVEIAGAYPEREFGVAVEQLGNGNLLVRSTEYVVDLWIRAAEREGMTVDEWITFMLTSWAGAIAADAHDDAELGARLMEVWIERGAV